MTETARDGFPGIRITSIGSVGLVVLLGEHDLSTATEVRNALDSLLERGLDVVVDLSEAEFIDSTTFHALEGSQERALERGMRITFQLGTHPTVARVLELTGALAAWPVFRTRREALEAVRHSHAVG